jgi:two-component system sensor histidine kinase VanS
MKKRGIFVKVFIYTVVFSALLVGVTAFLLLQQLQTYRTHAQIQAIVNSYQQIADEARASDDIGALAQRFYERNESFQFFITDAKGLVVYKTPNAETFEMTADRSPAARTAFDAASLPVTIKLDKDYDLQALKSDIFTIDYGKWIIRVILVSAAMLVVCVAGAFIFARQMTRPITALADSADKMANFQDVPPLPERNDELGALTRDVYSMYGKLKRTISNLEDEILRTRELEETQRYFFAAASHELKTPIAATSILLEGMLENVGDYRDHAKYLPECVRMMDAQGETISEILDIVKLYDGKITPTPERLNPGVVISDILSGLQALAEANGLRIVVDIPNELTCHADPKLLEKALSNIMTNAVQNTAPGNEVRIWSECAVTSCRLCILNTGAHIDDAILPKLFDPFYRVDRTRNRASGQSGLGLTIVQKTLEAMDVAFALENTPEGVLFWMDLSRA